MRIRVWERESNGMKSLEKRLEVRVIFYCMLKTHLTCASVCPERVSSHFAAATVPSLEISISLTFYASSKFVYFVSTPWV